jgi:diguanylate cyclase (GGDEF)-like protein
MVDGRKPVTQSAERRAALRDKQSERRIDVTTRKRVEQMSPEEMKLMLLTHELTGIPNRRAYQEAKKLPAQAFVDADSLKWFNDTLGHEAGDQVLREIASALAATTSEAYHISGDEFLIQGRSEDEVRRAVLHVRHLLQHTVVQARLPDGSVIRKRGLEISYGIGGCRIESEAALAEAKRSREMSGARAPRGEPPRRGLVRLGAAFSGIAGHASAGKIGLRRQRVRR